MIFKYSILILLVINRFFILAFSKRTMPDVEFWEMHENYCFYWSFIVKYARFFRFILTCSCFFINFVSQIFCSQKSIKNFPNWQHQQFFICIIESKVTVVSNQLKKSKQKQRAPNPPVVNELFSPQSTKMPIDSSG
jgi:hypothetical protein